MNLGRAYLVAGQGSKAITIFNQAIRKNQNNGEAYYLRGSERIKQRKLRLAYSDLRVAKMLGFTAASDKLTELQKQQASLK